MLNSKIHRNALLTLLALLLIGGAHANKSKLKYKITFAPPSNIEHGRVKNEIEQSGIQALVADFLQNNVTFNKPLSISFGGEDGPLYDEQTHEIAIPYSFYGDTKKRFIEAGYEAASTISAKEAATHALLHTVFHELAHALIADHEIPVVGRHEDAADSLATLLLLNYFAGGQEIAISAAELFNLESYDFDEIDETELSAEHSLDSQRFYQTLCLIYGSDPHNNKELIADFEFDSDRRFACEQDYYLTQKAWQKLLKNIISKDLVAHT